MQQRGPAAGVKQGKPSKRRVILTLTVVFVLILISVPLFWLLRTPPEPDPANVLWRQEIKGFGGRPTVQPLPNGNVAVFHGCDLTFIDKHGQIIEQILPPNHGFTVYGSRRISDSQGNTYCGYESDIQSYSPNGELRWTKTITAIGPPAPVWPHLSCSCQVTCQNTILVVCINGELVELTTGGETLRQLVTDISPGFSSIPFQLDDNTYITTYDLQHESFAHAFMAVDKTGKEIWKLSLKGDQLQEMEQFGDLVLVSVTDGHVTALATEGIAWEYTRVLTS